MTSAKKLKIPPIPPHIQEIKPYVAGKAAEELKRELAISSIIKLASNENPLGPSLKAVRALQKLPLQLSIYPDAKHYYLRKNIAEKHGLSMEEVFIGNGSNEIFDILIRSFCTTQDNIVSCGAAFIAYKICAKTHNVEYREAQIRDNLLADLDHMLSLCDTRTKIIFLPNPNNPTGTYSKEEDVVGFVQEAQKRNILVVMDCAYCEYVEAKDYPQIQELYAKLANLIITKTFSKIYGLAALRLGYALANPDILSPMWKVKMPFNVNGLALQAGIEALTDEEHVKKSKDLNKKSLIFLSKNMERLGFRYWPSQANFLLVDFKEDSKDIYTSLLKEGLITRPYPVPSFKTQLRISTGLEQENKKLILALEKYFKRKHGNI